VQKLPKNKDEKKKIELDPKAILKNKRNIFKGLKTRTLILKTIKKAPLSAQEIAEKIGRSYTATFNHLHALLKEKILEREKVGRKYIWGITGIGQEEIGKYLKT
jgi:predicted ArsR family transcriptional regulator